MDDTFDQLPLQLDSSSKAITANPGNEALNTELQALNALHRSFLSLSTPVPPGPMPVDPKRSAQVNKLRESGNASYKKGAYPEAIRMYTFGIEMASGRPAWEPSGLVREEISGLYANRAQTHMAMQNWPEALIDAETSVEMKPVGNAKAWWRKGRCLMEMGRLEEAKEWIGKGLELEGSEADMVGLMKEIDAQLRKRGAKGLDQLS
ncbi:MAG: hypothetical protein M1829_003089 [Trizodia sp. TS-e1964]|nr:MAG: hypothetical protein M1829_003089 [Trizodia sp. TS-e1964]